MVGLTLALVLLAPQLESAPAPPAPLALVQGLLPAAPVSLATAPTSPNDLTSPLRDVWQTLGLPAEAQALAGVRAEVELHTFDHGGGAVGTRHLVHEADFAQPARDRIEMPDTRRAYGRDGAAAWATIDGVAWHSREGEAGQLLDLLGLLLRAPWSFADERFAVFPIERETVAGKPMLRIRIERKPESGEDAVGPALVEPKRDRYELWCAPDSMLPMELRYRLRDSDEMRRVQLLDYRVLTGNLRVPVRRVVLDEAGRRLLEVEITKLQAQLPVAVERFRPDSAR